VPQNHEPVSWEAVTALGTAFTAMVVVVTAVASIGELRARRIILDVPVANFTANISGSMDYDEAITLLGFRFKMIGRQKRESLSCPLTSSGSNG